MNTTWHVYQIENEGVILYVGMSKKPRQRFTWHRSAKKLPHTAIMTVVRSFSTYRECHAFEAGLISALKPPMNGSHNCRELAGKARMPTDLARKIWLSDTKSLNDEVLRRMPGWTHAMAFYHFGSRTGNGPSAYSVRARDAAARQING